jgi:SAM-dependent methyltransferase
MRDEESAVASRISVYGDDLAHIQASGYGDFARGAAPGLLSLLRAAGIRDGTVLDLGCGAGVWLKALREAGYDARGLDASPALVRIARRAAPGASVRVGSVYTAALPRCDAITAIGEVLGYCPGAARRPPALAPFFARAARSLRRGGLLLFDLIVEGRALCYRTWRQGRGWALLAEIREDPARRRLVREITTFRRTGSGYRRGHERHVVRVVSRQEVESALRTAGFSVRALRRYGDFELAPRRLAFRARRL